MRLPTLVLAALALGFGAAGAHAQAWRVPVLLGSPCAGVVASLDFTGGRTCYAGRTYASPTQIPGWTFSRASAETVTNADGGVTYAASGAPAIGTAGLQISPAATNLMLQSSDYTQAVWSKSGAVITANATTAPDGSPADQVTLSATTNGLYQAFIGTVNPNDVYTCSAWLWATTPQTINLLLNGKTSPGNNKGVNIAVTTVPTRYAFSLTAVSDTGLYCLPASTAAASNGVPAINASRQVFVWGVQMEFGAETPYVPTTTTTATRNADALTVSFAGAPAKATISYGAGQTATINNPTSPLNLGASSGGAWVNSTISKVVIR